jgi:SHS2 domain-containing protein
VSGGSFAFVEGATSDLAFVATGATRADVFHAAAEALCAATVERPDDVAPKVVRTLALRDDDVELLLLAFLNELIYLRDAEGLVLRPLRVSWRDAGDGFELRAELAGEPLDRARHALASEVKAATAHGLAVRPTPEGWQAQVTLDI